MDVTALGKIMSSTFETGNQVTHTGVYWAEHKGKAHAGYGEQVLLIKDETFPPCKWCGPASYRALMLGRPAANPKNVLGGAPLPEDFVPAS